MDVLSDVLRAVRLTGAIYFDMSFRPPFVGEVFPMSEIAGSVMPGAERVISFHMLLTGSCFAEIVGADLPSVRLEAGALLPPTTPLTLEAWAPRHAGSGELLPPAGPPAFAPNCAQRAAARTRSASCGYLGCDARPFNLLSALPRLLHCPGGPEHGGWLAQVIHLAVEESDRHRTGGETILAKASELMFVEVVRSHRPSPMTSRNWLAGLREPTSAPRSSSSTAAPPKTGPSTSSRAKPACRARSSPTASPSTPGRRR